MIALSPNRFRRSVAAAFRPPPRASALEWIPAHVRMPDDTETPGPFDLDEFSHSGGVLEAHDDPETRIILLPWSSRLGKTITWIALLCFVVEHSPRPAMIGREDEDSTDQLLDTQVLPVLLACPPLRDKVPPKQRRSVRRGLRLRRMLVRKSYSGSPGSMAGFPAAYGFASELSKWSQRRSGEAAPAFLFMKRAWGFPFDSKFVMEGTPATKGSCQMTELCNQPGVDVRRREVPCPHCGAWQELLFGDETSAAGLKWDKLPDGRSDAGLAEQSAHYQCANGCRIDDEDRLEMLQRGVWLSEGQTVSGAPRKPRIRGQRPSAKLVAFGHPERHPFGALYSSQVSGWGMIAREWIEKKGSREGRREFYNQTLGMLWDPAPATIKPSQLSDRMGWDFPLRIVPHWASFLSGGVDVGRAGEILIFYWWISAWGQHSRGALVDFGIELGREPMQQRIGSGAYPLEQNRQTAIRPAIWGVDSGTFTESVYDFCNPLPEVWPIKCSSRDKERPFVGGDFPEMIKGGVQRAGVPEDVVRAKLKARAYDLLIINTARSQGWCEERLQGFVKPEERHWYSVPKIALDGQPLPGIDLARQMLGDYEDERGCWQKRTHSQDFRDAWRISLGMAWLVTANGQAWEQMQPLTSKKRQPSLVISAGDTLPDGREW